MLTAKSLAKHSCFCNSFHPVLLVHAAFRSALGFAMAASKTWRAKPPVIAAIGLVPKPNHLGLHVRHVCLVCLGFRADGGVCGAGAGGAPGATAAARCSGSDGVGKAAGSGRAAANLGA